MTWWEAVKRGRTNKHIYDDVFSVNISHGGWKDFYDWGKVDFLISDYFIQSYQKSDISSFHILYLAELIHMVEEKYDFLGLRKLIIRIQLLSRVDKSQRLIAKEEKGGKKFNSMMVKCFY